MTTCARRTSVAATSSPSLTSACRWCRPAMTGWDAAGLCAGQRSWCRASSCRVTDPRVRRASPRPMPSTSIERGRTVLPRSSEEARARPALSDYAYVFVQPSSSGTRRIDARCTFLSTPRRNMTTATAELAQVNVIDAEIDDRVSIPLPRLYLQGVAVASTREVHVRKKELKPTVRASADRHPHGEDGSPYGDRGDTHGGVPASTVTALAAARARPLGSATRSLGSPPTRTGSSPLSSIE